MAKTEFDIVLVGATGFTGLLVAKDLVLNAPTTLRWALAGRSQSKLDSVLQELKKLNPSLALPGTIVVDTLKYEQCIEVVERTTCVITTVGPYSILGETLLRACATKGVHYCDLTGEIPFVKKMIGKYEKVAQDSGSIIVCCSGFDSIPVDLTNFLVAKYIKENYNAGTIDAKTVVEDLRGAASGGTLASVFSLLDIFSLKEISAAHAPWSISPRKGSNSQKGTPHVLWDADTKLYCASWVGDNVDRSRSWGILDYGDDWTTYGYLGFSYWWKAYGYLALLYIGTIMIGVPPVRWLLKRIVTQPGSGPSQSQMDNGRMYMRAFGTSDKDSKKRAVATFRINADPGYKGTAAMLACGTRIAVVICALGKTNNLVGLVLAFDAKKTAAKPGFMTPATLGDALVKRLESNGMQIEVSAL